MRKTLSIVLSVIMVLAMFTFGISAEPEGTPISSAADFAAMTEDGVYYLASDIAISVPYAKEFKGTLDGNGHTVTVSNCPMFDIIVEATIKNLKITGSINSNNAPAAALVVRVVDKITVIDVTTDVNVSVTGNRQGLYAAGLVATTNIVSNDNVLYYDGKQPENNTSALCTFVRCVNNGDISVVLEGIPATDPDTTKTGDDRVQESTVKPRAGGIAAVGQDFVCVDCVNTGDVTALGASSSIAGGIVARPGLKGQMHIGFYIGCDNSGAVTSNSYAGGITGYDNGGSGSLGTHYYYGCTNSGTITGPSFCGGIVGYMWASGSNSYCDMEFCVNTGKLIYGRPANADTGAVQTSYVSGWIAYTNSDSTTVRCCIDYVDRQLADGAVEWSNAIVCVSSRDPLVYYMEYNYLVDPTGYVKEFSSWNNASDHPEYVANKHAIDEAGDLVTVLANDDIIKSGEVAYICNKESEDLNAWFSDADPAEVNRIIEYYQKIGTDNVPSTKIVEENYVLYDGTKYYNGKKGEEVVETTPEQTTEAQQQGGETTTAAQGGEEQTTAPQQQGGETTTASQQSGKKGCGGFVGAGVAVIALLGAAFVSKKKF